MQARSALGLCLAGLLFLTIGKDAPAAPPAEPSAADTEFFEKEIRPLLAAKCWTCHGQTKHKGGLQLTTRAAVLQGGDVGPAAVAGKPEESLLVEAVRYQSNPRMPPRGKLAPREVLALERWVALGLPWPGTPLVSVPDRPRAQPSAPQRPWALQPVRPVPVPAARSSRWARSPVDSFILAGLEAHHLEPAPPADRRTLLRRATYDLTGLPPTLGEIDAFLADDSPDAFARVVDRLLASPRYGEHWGRTWLDLVRYADARDLIQLPPESDFREAWRYRDWVVRSFNRDLPYSQFLRLQVAGDLIPGPQGEHNPDGLVATGMLALADFVPGEGDKEKMIADYVNDEIDVVGRGFLGLSLACARCHDHKFDPISMDDYYSLAGIFFSTRLIPGPTPGNTPLIRVPLLSSTELARVRAQETADKKRRAELEQLLPDALDRELRTYLKTLATEHTASYLVAACEYRQAAASATKPTVAELARKHHLEEALLSGWLAFLDRIQAQPAAPWPSTLRDAAAGKLTGTSLEEAAHKLQQALAALSHDSSGARSRAETGLAQATLLQLRADDPFLQTDSAGRVTLWPNRSALSGDATPPTQGCGPWKTTASINGRPRPVLRFDGATLLEAPRRAPPAGTLLVVFRPADTTPPSSRLLGWEDSDVGKHGLGLTFAPGGGVHAILRNNSQVGDMIDAAPAQGFQTVCVTWGPAGASLHRNGTRVAQAKGLQGLSSDPAIAALRLGGPGSGSCPRFQGEIAEVRVYNRPLEPDELRRVQAQLQAAWLESSSTAALPVDPLLELYEELLSPRGPFWICGPDRSRRLPAEVRLRVAALNRELEDLRKKGPPVIPQAVAVQEGGPMGTRHEGFKDCPVFQRGDPHRPGKTVPRGIPALLTGSHLHRPTQGSGRLQLADWLARDDNPLTTRVMVNRIWQHHFGAGLVRTPNDFGARGERPTHPELLDYLAARFVQSGWSVKQMHRLLMLSAVYQQTSRADPTALAQDPGNHWLSRMNRRPLPAEAIRDSLLMMAGRLDEAPGGPPFTDLAVPRRTLYLQSARTGARTADFGRLFDRPDPGSIVGQRTPSVVAPQALFFLNDPFVIAQARSLAARVARQAPPAPQGRIECLYAIVLGRPPSKAELDLGLELLAPEPGLDPWERYCHTILCTNELLFVD